MKIKYYTLRAKYFAVICLHSGSSSKQVLLNEYGMLEVSEIATESPYCQTEVLNEF